MGPLTVLCYPYPHGYCLSLLPASLSLSLLCDLMLSWEGANIRDYFYFIEHFSYMGACVRAKLL